MRKNNCGLSNIYSVVEHEAITFFVVTVLSLILKFPHFLFEILSFVKAKMFISHLFFFCSSVGSVYCHVMSYTCVCMCARAHASNINCVTPEYLLFNVGLKTLYITECLKLLNLEFVHI